MKAFHFINLLVTFLFAAVAFVNPRTVSATQPQWQTGTTIAATGQICDAAGGNCTTSMQLTFNPAGGPVTGSFSGSGSIPGAQGMMTTFETSGSLDGTFEGGDGGAVSGTLSGHTDTTTSFPGLPDQSASQDWTGTWEGTLRADGTGGGTISTSTGGGGTWSVTFDGQAFQAALVTPTPTSFSVAGQKVQLTSKAREFIANSPTLDEATKAVLNQDSVLIVRDDNNHFYAINNKKKAIPLPASLGSTFQLNDAFGVLGNDSLLDKAGYGDMRDDINGGSQAGSLDKIPGDLKNRDYMSLTTKCSPRPHADLGSHVAALIRVPVRQGDLPDVCQDLLRSHTPDTSFHTIPPDWNGEFFSVESSEHSSVRGTINGGGDFIYLPLPAGNPKLISLSIGAGRAVQDGGNQPYLGVHVQNTGDSAIVTMVQAGSPAEQAGLVIGDKVVSVSGSPVDAQNTLAALIGQHAGGDQVDLGIVRNDNQQTIGVMLAILLPPKIVTPSAEITVTSDTELVVDIGFNGVTGVLVLADTAHVREPVTGSEVDVPAGSVVIVVPGYEIGAPIPVSDGDINAWWEESSLTPTLQPENTPHASNATPVPQAPTPPPASLPWGLLLVAACMSCCVGVMVLAGVVILIVRRSKR
jgi:hypothetical protein